ncbi:MAG: hypothetical protein K6L76_02970 [Agarilytica sp.]
MSPLQNYLEPQFAQSGRLDSLTSLFLAIGGAMIGATAIAFSLIMFAMQVNVERMPHGLFRKFSSDIKLLGVFASTFSLAIIITVLSLISDKSFVAIAILVSIWCSSLIIVLFMVAYRRALDLISPTKQLSLVVLDTKKNFNRWDRAVRRTAPIIRANMTYEEEGNDLKSMCDLERLTYFQLHPEWTSLAKQTTSYCIAFSRRYAEQRDHEVSRVALNGIVAIHAFYIEIKGKTFFSNSFMVENPLAHDDFLSETLEHIRQNVQLALSRKDEQFLELNLHCYTHLAQSYLTVEYANKYAEPTHAHLVLGYLARSVESVIPHGMADVLLEGVRQLGKSAKIITHNDKNNYVATISNKISSVACVGAVNRSYQPVAQVAVKELADLTFEILRSKSFDVRYLVEEVRDGVKQIAEMYLQLPETPLSRTHSFVLAYYYSASNHDGLLEKLTELVNALSNSPSEDETAIQIIRHFDEWSENLYLTEKQLLIMAVEKRSQFTQDLLRWIVQVTKILLAVSSLKACDDLHRDKLRESARRLINVFSWVQVNGDTIRFLETFRISDRLFESSYDAYNRDCLDEAIEIRNLLLRWTCKIGKFQNGWGSLKTAFSGLVCLNLVFDSPDEVLTKDIDDYLSSDSAASIDIRSRAAADLREEADKYHVGHSHRDIDIAMARLDQSRLHELLHKVADHLYPESKDFEGPAPGNISQPPIL